MSTQTVEFNALHDPWIPVLTVNGDAATVSLGDALDQAHTLAKLDDRQLHPVEHESILRLIVSAAASALTRADGDTIIDSQRLPDSLSQVLAQHDVFTLGHPQRPFFQEWAQLTPEQQTEIADGKTLLPLPQMDPHVPGESSMQWGLRAIQPESELDAAAITRLLVLTWFHSNFSNAAAPTLVYLGRRKNGAPMGGSKTTAHFYLQGRNLGDTILANIPQAWLRTPPVPAAWADQSRHPQTASEAATFNQSAWAYTWTPNRPRIIWDTEHRPCGYVIGLSRTAANNIPLPPSGQPDKDWGAVFKTWAETLRTDDPTLPPNKMGSRVPANLQQAQGILTWYRNNLDQWIQDWANDRLLDKGSASHVLVFREEPRDSYGTLDSAALTTVPQQLLTSSAVARAYVADIVALADHLTKAMGIELKAIGGLAAKQQSPLRDEAVTLFYTRVDLLVLEALNAYAHYNDEDTQLIGERHIKARNDMTRIAVEVFRDITAPLRAPATTAQIENHRASFAQRAHKHKSKT